LEKLADWQEPTQSAIRHILLEKLQQITVDLAYSGIGRFMKKTII